MSESMTATFVTMASSIGIVMQNAATNERSGQQVANASLAVCCALIIQKGASSA